MTNRQPRPDVRRLGELVRFHREAMGYSRETLSQKINYRYSTRQILHLELHQKEIPPAATLRLLAQECGIDWRDILEALDYL